MALLDSVLGWVGQNKAVCALSVLLFAFFISTIALAVQKNNLAAELETCGVTTPPPTPQNLKHRLPLNIIPTHYDLFLHPDLEKETFTGKVTIFLKVHQIASRIVLNSFKQDITSVELFSPSSQKIDTDHELSEDYQSLVVTPKSGNLAVTTETTTYSLVIEFGGVMREKNVGLYSSKYKRINDGTEVTISSSKFQPTYARQAFPCFDEPAFKATYNISLVRPTEKGYRSLSNMPEVEQVDGPGENEVTVKFEQSPQMSTYLAVFLVADFIHQSVEIENPLGENFNLTIYLPEGQEEKGKFALSAAKNIIEYYIEYFDIEYPLPKLDMAAIPEYVSGATEHWGLVTFRETSLLWEESEGSTRNKQRVASVIAHELAHMWFGNLVTCEWWNDIWLNEGFASYIEYKGLTWLNWNMDEQFLIEDLHGVMELDSKVASHPIVQEATIPDEITALFDSIAYSKGASIIRMLEGFVENEVFRTGVQKFLKDYRYKSVVTADFFRYMDEVTEAEINVTQIMSTWTEQKGYPVVTVKRINDTSYELTQERFLLNPDSKQQETDESPFRWHIPITFMSDKKNSDKVLWMKPSDTNIQINIESESKWIKVNDKQIGYYIVNYDNWDEIINQVNTGDKFTPMDRAQLLHDSFKLADSLNIPYNIPMELSTYLLKTNETAYAPWSVISSKLLTLQGMLDNPSMNLITYVREQLKNIYDFVNPENIQDDEPHLKKLLREKIMNLACHFEYDPCLLYVKEHFQNYLDDAETKPNVDIRQSVYYHGMRYISIETNWDKVFERFVNENDPQERAKLMEALAGTSSSFLLMKYLDIAQNKTGPIKMQDYVSIMQYIAYNRNGEQLVWDYVRNHWENITNIIDINDRNLGRMIPNITRRFKTEAQLKELEQFIEDHKNAGAGEAARKEAVETIKYNIKWSEQNKEVIDTWLREYLSS